MSRLVLPALAVLASVCLPTITQAQMSPPEPKFTDHPVTTVYRGPVAAPAFTGPGKDWQAYRTRIRDGMRGGTTYAGQFAIIMIAERDVASRLWPT